MVILTVFTCLSLHQKLSATRLERDDFLSRLTACRNALDIANRLNVALQEELRNAHESRRVTAASLTTIAATIGQVPTPISSTNSGDAAAESTT